VARDLEGLPFSLDEYKERRRKTMEGVDRLGADAALVFLASSVDYLCGYHTVATTPQPVLITEDRTCLYMPAGEVGRALASSCARDVLYWSPGSDTWGLVADHVAETLGRNARLLVEKQQACVPPAAIAALETKGLKVADGQYVVEECRLVLSQAEIRCVERAAVHTQRGVEAAVRAATSGEPTDSDVAAAIAQAIFCGANSPPARGLPIVATGSRGGITHSTWNGTLIDGITFLEFAGAHDRYQAPVMRTLAHRRLSKQEAHLAELAQTAVESVLGVARAGMSCAEVAHEATKALGSLDESIVFHYNFGYPVGIAHPPTWMDGAPFHITEQNAAPLQEGMVFHLPASFRIPGVACVGLSQTFVVEGQGARALTLGSAEIVYT
jgi:Xaa-Pro dipeptidase